MKNVQRFFFIVSLTWLVMFLSVPVYAGPFTDEMSRCIVTRTTDSDRILLVQWVYAAMSFHPDVKPMASVSPKMGEDLNRRVANLVMELLTVRCKEACQKAYKFEGAGSMKTSFGVLGNVAMKSITSHPKFKEYVSSFATYLDKEKLEKELGLK